MRQIIIFIVALMALSGSVVAALATAQQRDFDLRGYVDPTQNANLPYRVPRLGVNASLQQYTPEELEAQLDLMESANVTWIRQIVSWADVEPEPDEFNWETWDTVIEAVYQREQFRPIIVFYGVPEWARSEQASDEPTSPPESPDEFAAFVGEFASRYGYAVDHYQIWDEPNLREAWGYLDPRPTEYFTLLQAGYTVIHSADAEATVLAAALAPTTETGPHNINEWQYLSTLYDLGAADFMDGIGAKPYGFNRDPTDRTISVDVLNVSRVIGLREEMVKRGDGHKAIWASNWGWNSLPDDWAGEPSIWGKVNEQTRINYTLALLDRAEREWAWMAGMTLFHWQPIADNDDPIWGFALVDQEDNSTPLLEALQARGISPFATNGLYSPENPYTQYSGVWTFGDLGADIGWLSDSRFTFDFYGQDVAMLVRQGDYVAYFYPTVNGQAPNQLPKDADGNPYLLLTSPTLESEVSLVSVARNLPNGEHQLEAVADRGWDQWVLVGFAVSSGDLAAPYNRQIRIAWITAFVAAIATIITVWQFQWSALFERLRIQWKPVQQIIKFGIGLAASGLLLLGMFLTWGDGSPSLLKRGDILLGASLATAGLIYIEPGLILTFIAVVVLFFILFNNIEFGLLLTILWAPFFLFPVQLYLYAFPMGEIMVLLTFGAWLLRSMIEWAKAYKADAYTTKINLSATDWGIIGFVALAFLSLLWTDYLDPALTELRVMVIEPVLLYIMLRTTICSQRIATWLIDALLFSAVAACIISIGMYIGGENVITAEGDARRLAGIYGSPNNMALFLGRVIPFAIAYTLLLKAQRRIFGGTVLLISLVAFALTQSVGGLFIGLPVAITIVLLLIWQRRAMLPLAGLAVIGAGLFAFLSRFPRFGGVLDFTSGTNFRRIRVWESGINVVRDYPVTGLGLDQFLYAFRSHYILPDAWQEPDLNHPHNFLLDFWIRLGILGVILFVWLQVAFWRNIYQLYIHQQHPLILALTIGCAGSMANLLAHGLVDNSVFVNDLAMIFVLLLALPQQLTMEESE